jgi:2-polyprenyl-3-methyl-5-hydroxy-6-metoxy-1,4-benzoquinol methylase
VGPEYILPWLARGTHRWDRFPEPAELRKLLAREGLEVRDGRGVRANPFTQHFALTGFLTVNYRLAVHRSDGPGPFSGRVLPTGWQAGRGATRLPSLGGR